MEAPRSRPSPVVTPPVTPGAGPWRGLAGSFRFAWDGIVETALHQRNMRIHLVAALWVALLGGAVAFGTAERLALLLCVFLVLSAEVANSALEALVDLVTRERHELARAAKDAGAGAVLVLAAGAVAVLALVILRARQAPTAWGATAWHGTAGLALTVAVVGLLAPARRPRSLDLALAAAGVLLLVAVAARTVSVVFTALAGVVFLVATAVAFRRRALR